MMFLFSILLSFCSDTPNEVASEKAIDFEKVFNNKIVSIENGTEKLINKKGLIKQWRDKLDLAEEITFSEFTIEKGSSNTYYLKAISDDGKTSISTEVDITKKFCFLLKRAVSYLLCYAYFKISNFIKYISKIIIFINEK